MLSFFLPLLYFTFFTFTLVLLTRKSFGKCLPISFFTAAFLLFFSQLIFNTFNVGFWLGIIVAVAAIPLSIWRIKQLGWQWVKKKCFSTGAIAFFVIYVLVFIFDFKRGISVWDEWAHWGTMLKEMFRLDHFYFVDESNLISHRDYPPILQLFELFWNKLCGNYSEAYAERAVHTFMLTLFIPMIFDYWTAKKQIFKKIGLSIAACIPVVLTILLFDQHGVIATIYNDYPMAMLVIYLIAVIVTSKNIGWFEIVAISMGGGFLLLMKQMGLPLYLMIVCLLAGILVARNKQIFQKLLNKKHLKKTFLAIIILGLPFVWWGIWNALTSDLSHQFDLNKLSVFEYIKMLIGQGGEDWQRTVAYNYLHALSQKNISTSYLQFSFLSSIALFLVGIIYYYRKLKNKTDKQETLVIGAIMLIGAIGYASAMLFLYPTSFSRAEGLQLASFERYMGTYSIILLTVVIILLLSFFLQHKRYLPICCMALVAIIVTAPSALTRIAPELTSQDPNRYVYEAEFVRNTLGEESQGAKIFTIAQRTTDYPSFLQYYLNDYHLNGLGDIWKSTDASSTQSYYEDTIKPTLLQYDYLYVVEANDNFQTNYCPLLTDQCPMPENTIYKIEKTETGTINLTLIASKK